MKKNTRNNKKNRKDRMTFDQIQASVIEKERNKQKQKNNESIGDYNSRFGTTSTWSGDAGWMDDD
jgi:hypothetical protein